MQFSDNYYYLTTVKQKEMKQEATADAAPPAWCRRTPALTNATDQPCAASQLTTSTEEGRSQNRRVELFKM